VNRWRPQQYAGKDFEIIENTTLFVGEKRKSLKREEKGTVIGIKHRMKGNKSFSFFRSG